MDLTSLLTRHGTALLVALRGRRVISQAARPLRLWRPLPLRTPSSRSSTVRTSDRRLIQQGWKATCVRLAFVILAAGAAIGSPARAETQDKAQSPDGNQQQTEENRQKEAEEVERLQDLFLRSQFVFIRKGEVIVEYNFLYSTDSRIIPVGSAQSIKTSRRFMDNILLARFGLARHDVPRSRRGMPASIRHTR